MIDKTLPGGISPAAAPMPWDSDPVVTPPAESASPWQADPESNGKGRLRSAGETFVQTMEAGAGKAVEGLGNFAGVVIDAVRGGKREAALRELDTLNHSIGNALKLPDSPDVLRLREDLRGRANDLRRGMGLEDFTKLTAEGGVKIGEDAATRFAPNPAYAGEFFADTVPQVGGSAVASVAPFLVPGGQVAGVAAMFGQTYQGTVDENLAKGVDEETAIRRGLLNGIVSGGLEVIGEGIVAGAMKKLVAQRTLKGAARHIAESTVGEGLTGAAQEGAGELIDEEKLNWSEIAKQGALEALGGFMLSGGAATAGKVAGLAGKPKVDAKKPWMADPETGAVTLGEEGKPMESDPLAAPAAEVQAPAPATAAAAVAAQPGASPAVAPAPAPVDPYFLRNRQRQDAAGLGWTAEALNKLSDEELGAVVRERRRYEAPRDPRTTIILEAARAQREELAKRKAFEAGEMTEEDATPGSVAEDETPIDPDNVPFSKQPDPRGVVAGHAEAARLQGIMEQQWRDVGEKAAPAVIVVNSAADIPAQLGGETIRQAVQTGSIVEAYFVQTQRKSGEQVRRIILIRDGAFRVAGDRGISLDDRVRQLALHEIVHHHASLGVLFRAPVFRGAYAHLVDGLLQRMRTAEPALLAYLTKPKAEGGYGYDLSNTQDRQDAVEEYLARFAESPTPAPGWFAEAMAQIRTFLRAAFDIAWTDADVRALLASARKRAATVSAGAKQQGGMRLAMQPAWIKRIDQGGALGESGSHEDTAGHLERALESADRLGRRSGTAGARDGGGVTAESLLRDGALPELDHEALRQGIAQARNLGRNEHLVFHPDDSARAYKITKPGEYGARGDIVEYLRRLKDSNRLFDDDMHLVGAVRDPESGLYRLVISQPWIADARGATQAEITAYFEGKGFLRYSERAFYNPATEMLVSDAETVNVLTDKTGAVFPIDVIPQQVAARAAEMYENVVRRRKDDEEGRLRMSAQPSQAEAEQAGRNPEARRRFMESVAAAPGVAPMAARLESIYQPITNKETVEAAKAHINDRGLDRALADVLATGAGNPPTALTNAIGIELMGRLQALHRYDETAALAEHIAEQATTQGQAIQALSLLARLTPEGINIYTQRILQRANKADPEMVRMAEMIKKLKEELRNARTRQGTAAILDLGALIDEATTLTPEQKTDLMRKLREALVTSNTEEGKALARLTQIAMDAGIKRDQAVRMARRAIEAFRKAQKAARGKLLREMLRAAVEGASRAPMPKTAIEKWVAMNEEGILDDETMFAGIAKKWGLPVFTKEHAMRIQELQRAYEAAPTGDLKLAAAAKMMQSIHELVPVDFWTKVRAVRNMAMLLNPKTIIRNIGGNVALWLADVPADTLAWGLDKGTSLVTSARTRTGLQMAAKFQGLASPVTDYNAGYDYAKQQGRAHGLWKAGVDHMLTMARLTSGGVFHEGGIQSGFRHVFSSRAMRLLEDGLSLALGVADRAFHQGAFQASLVRQMDAERANTGMLPVSPTPAMIEAALLDANTAVFQDDNVVSRTLKALQRTLNLNAWGKDEKKFGLGNIIVPFTQVPGSIAARAAGVWSPVGFIRGIYEGRHLIYNRGAFDQRAFTDLLSRGALGTGLGFLGFYLFRLGIMSALPEDDPDREAMRKAAGLGQYRINVSELLRRMLSGNWSTPAGMMEAAQDGDEIRNYDWLQPLAVPLAAGAQIAAQEADRARTLAHGKTVSDLAAPFQGLAAGMQTLEAQPLVSSFTRFMRDAGREASPGQPVAGLTGALLKAGTEEMASGFIPTALRQIGQLGDNTERETRATPLFGIAAAIPGVSAKFPPKYDVLGEMQERYQAGTNGIVNVLLNPAFSTKVKADPVLREMDALYERTGDPSVTLPLSKRSVNVNQRNLELTNEQRSDYARVSGRVSTSLLRELIAAPAYATLPDDTKASVAAKRISAAGTVAKMILFGHRPDHASADVQRAILHARALGLVKPRE